MPEIVASQQIRVADGATGAAVGSKCYGYVIHAVAADVKVEFRKDTNGGTVIWEDDIVFADISKPHSFTKPMGRQGTDVLFCLVTGAGGSCDVQFD